MGSFGERMRREREMRNVSLDDIAEGTKIGTRLLRALEEEQFELLPGGIFNKGFVRAYAKYLGLNEEEAVADYLEAAGETIPDPRLIAEQNSSRIDRAGSDVDSSRPAGFPIIPVLILLLVIAAGAGGWQVYQQRQRDRQATRAPSSSNTVTSHAVASEATNQIAASTDSTGSKEASSLPGATKVMPQAVSGSASPASGDAAASGQSFEVTVRAKDRAWVSIKSDGQIAVRGIIVPPDVKNVHANDQVVFFTGNAGAVEVLFNGQPVSLVGGPNQEGVLVFNSHGAVSPKQTP